MCMFAVLSIMILFPSTWAGMQIKKEEEMAGAHVCPELFLASLPSRTALPGWLWKRLRTLLSGVLKKAVAMELYSPSAQNN